MTEEQIMELRLTPLEVLASTGALYADVMKRLEWASTPNHWYRRDVPLEEAQNVFNALVSSYQQLMLLAQTLEADIHIEWLPTFSFTPEEWEKIDALTLADKWRDVATDEAQH